MATGDLLRDFAPEGGYYTPDTNFPTPDRRNLMPVLDFDATTQETVYFKGRLPSWYGGNGFDVAITSAMTSAVAGTVAWDIAFARLNDNNQDIDALAFDTATGTGGTTVNATSGKTVTQTATIAVADTDALAANEWFIVRVRRDVATDTATGDAELVGIAIKEH